MNNEEIILENNPTTLTIDDSEIDDIITDEDDNFDIAGIEIEEGMPDDLKAAITRYNQIHANFASDISQSEAEMKADDEDIETSEVSENSESSEIVAQNETANIQEDKDSEVDLSDIF